MKNETLSVRFLYNTVIGRIILKVLTRPFISKIAGVFLDSPLSKFMVSRFIKKNDIDMSSYEKTKYKSFNSFFMRQRIQYEMSETKDKLISPCDAFLSAYEIGENVSFDIKNAKYSIEQLVDSIDTANLYKDGICLIFRLTPKHYHRYIFSCTGKISEKKRIKGILHCVRPIAYTEIPVFTQNTREMVRIDTDNMGTIVQMEIGALIVGKITNYSDVNVATQGKEKGYFEFGGSTIVLLVQKDKVNLTKKVTDLIHSKEEVSVCMGETIASILSEEKEV